MITKNLAVNRNQFGRHLGSFAFVLGLVLGGPHVAYAFCLFNCETPEQTQARLAAEAKYAAFLNVNDIGEKKTYVYTDGLLAGDLAKGWRLILIVDRATDGQTLKVYQDGVLKQTWPVSTALEGYKVKPHVYGHNVFVTTPLGRFLPLHQEQMWHSQSWDEDMPFSTFFTVDGVAFHATVTKREADRLGTRASSGCVRLAPERAEVLFNLIRKRFRETLIVVQESRAKETSETHP